MKGNKVKSTILSAVYYFVALVLIAVIIVASVLTDKYGVRLRA